MKALLARAGKEEHVSENSGPIMLRGVQFVDHPVLRNLKLNFCDEEGTPVDTIIFAGENGTGKSTIISSLDDVMSRRYSIKQKIIFEVQTERGVCFCSYNVRQNGSADRYCHDSSGKLSFFTGLNRSKSIYSDVDINFKGGVVRTVTSLAFDSESGSMHSTIAAG